MTQKKPKLLIIGHARHGKDTFAEMLVKKMNLSFVSSSEFVGRRCIWTAWGEERYASFDEMFEDRVNFRSTWKNLILAYNTPDLSRTGTEMMKDHDIYVGMRDPDEFLACMDKDLFDYVIWVDGSERHPPEGKDSNGMVREMASMLIDNNGPEENMVIAVDNLQKRLHYEGYAVNYVPTPGEMSTSEFSAVTSSGSLEIPIRDDGIPDVAAPMITAKDETAPSVALGWEQKPEGSHRVLDHGFIKVLEVMGSDESICESARMSYGRGTKKVNNDKGLINYLVKNHHTSPLEMGVIRFHIRMPIFVMRQWVRHRTANLNEYSGRYSEMVRLFYVPEEAQIRTQNTTNKQGSADPVDSDLARDMQKTIRQHSEKAFDAYEDLLAESLSRETARIILPLNTYTEVVWKLDVSNLIKFLWLRDDDHAQWEIREYAIWVAKAVKEYFPLVYDAYQEARQSQTFSMDEIRVLVTKDLSFLNSNSQALRISTLIRDIES